MTTIAVGDIHGNSKALSDLLAQLTPELGAGDTLVFLGDYVDRGPDTRGCIDFILEFQDRIPAKVVSLLGNHEDWLLRTFRDHTRHSWVLGMEAFETIRSYSPDAERALRRELKRAGLSLVTGRVRIPYEVLFDRMPVEHARFLLNLKSFCRTPEAVCVHGGLDPRRGAAEEQAMEALLWGADGFPEGYEGCDLVVYGHWDNAAVDPAGWPRPKVHSRTIGIDTISRGVLTAIRLPDRRVFQSKRYD